MIMGPAGKLQVLMLRWMERGGGVAGGGGGAPVVRANRGGAARASENGVVVVKTAAAALQGSVQTESMARLLAVLRSGGLAGALTGCSTSGSAEGGVLWGGTESWGAGPAGPSRCELPDTNSALSAAFKVG
jgi:hypothetical protein